MYVCVCVEPMVALVCVRVYVGAYVNAFWWKPNLFVSMGVL